MVDSTSYLAFTRCSVSGRKDHAIALGRNTQEEWLEVRTSSIELILCGFHSLSLPPRPDCFFPHVHKIGAGTGPVNEAIREQLGLNYLSNRALAWPL